MSWHNLLDRTKHGVRATLRNAAIALREDDRVKGKIAFNEFTDCAVVIGVLPWNSHANRQWTEHDDLCAAEWLQGQDIHVTVGIAHDAANLVAYERRFHPVVDWLEGLEWDGDERLTNWFTTYLGVPKSPLANAFGRAFMISGVARVMRPGCKVDHLPILEGRQGGLKSTALNTLVGDEWFTDQIADLGTKDSSQDLRGKWVIELSELSAIRPHEAEKVKAYITRRCDHYRPSYGRQSRDFPRQTVFVGTTNSREYLSDSTGARRFWPVQCTAIDIPALAADREQLWAEAVDAYHQGEAWWLTDEELTRAAEAEQELRRTEEPWEDVIADWLENPTKQTDKDGYRAPYELKNGRVRTTEILTHAIGMPTDRQNMGAQKSVGRVMHRLGWEKTDDSRGRKVWVQPAPTDRTARDESVRAVATGCSQPTGPQGESDVTARTARDSHAHDDDISRNSHEPLPGAVGAVNAKKSTAKEVNRSTRAQPLNPANGGTAPPVVCGHCGDPIHEPDGVPMFDVRVHQRCSRLYRDTLRTRQ